MPKKPGIVLYRKIRSQKQWARIPVVLISGMSDPKQFDFSALAPGNNLPEPEAYLEKPIKVSLLLETVKRLTE
jgi:response regulator RpfG family c-di-GMP phosphodiesterase